MFVPNSAFSDQITNFPNPKQKLNQQAIASHNNFIININNNISQKFTTRRKKYLQKFRRREKTLEIWRRRVLTKIVQHRILVSVSERQASCLIYICHDCMISPCIFSIIIFKSLYFRGIFAHILK